MFLKYKKLIVDVGDAKISSHSGILIVTHALGSCIGITAYDKVANVGGILHYMLPIVPTLKKVGYEDEWKYGELAIPRFFKLLYKRGATKKNIRVTMAGGANVLSTAAAMPVGSRNTIIAERLFRENHVFVDAQETGGKIPRTLYLEIGTGRVWLSSGNEIKEL